MPMFTRSNIPSRATRIATTFVLLTAACDADGAHRRSSDAAGGGDSGSAPPTDSAFAAMQARAADPRGMGVDQYASVHLFDTLPDGARIELQRDPTDTAGVAAVRSHLQGIVSAFTSGDFSTPAFVHMARVPGTDVMAARRAVLRYRYEPLPGGGAVRITSIDASDTTVVRAVHAFIMFQRREHHAGGH